jgi:hypothetical protein
VLPLAVLFSTLMIGSASADSSVCAQAFGSFSASNYPSGCWRPYSSSSPFNHPLPPNPTIASDSASIVSNLTANDDNFEGGSGQFAFTSDDGRDGVYYSRPSDPTVTINCTYYWGPGTCSGANKVNVDGQQIHIPAGAMPQDNGTDMHMTVVDQTNQIEYDFEHATWSADHKTLNVWSSAEIPAGPNLGTGLGSGGTAAGTATLAGLITEPELASGTINHALAINVPCTNGAVYPAEQANGLACNQEQGQNNTGTAAPLGSLFQLNMTDAQIANSGAPAWEKTIMTAMAHYGMYVNDTDGIGNIELEAESDISYTSLGGQPLLSNFIKAKGGWFYSPLNRWIMAGPGIAVSKLRVVDPCWAEGLCAGSSALAPTPPTTTSPVPPRSTPATAPAPAAPTPTPVAGAPVSPKPSPVRPTPVRHAPKKQTKPARRTNLAHTASVRAPTCRASRSRTARKGASRPCATAAVVRATPDRRSAGRRRPR